MGRVPAAGTGDARRRLRAAGTRESLGDGEHVLLEVRDARGARNRQHHGRMVEEPAQLERRSRRPSPSGLQGKNAIPSSSHACSTSSEMRRPRLYWFCTETIFATDCAARSCSSEKFETPISRIFPSSRSSLERPDRLLDRHLGIVAVQLVEVDALELQPPQARLARLAEVLGPAVADSAPADRSRARPSLRSRARPGTDGAPRR